MAAIVENVSGVEDAAEGWKTYYLRVHADHNVFYKIGVCKGRVSKRYSKESAETRIEILKIWPQESEEAALRYEDVLFKIHSGDRPFVGRCGPFKHGGNTETYSHDVIGGEPPPHNYIVRIYRLHGVRLHTIGYSGANPRSNYEHLHGEVKYMDYSFGPEDVDEGPYLQVPYLSHSTTVTIATRDFLENLLEDHCPSRRDFPKKLAADALKRYIVVSDWTDYSAMEFEGSPFHVDKWDDWV